MKRKLQVLLITLTMSVPMLASAQSSAQGLTREQVRQETADYAAAGYNPARMNPRTWVDDAHAASAKVMLARAEGASNQLAANKSEDNAHCN
ncbi:DUF4148 domain-containing protein [Paraburkholderia sp. DD10]|uniref:DUF4148 domain-containing protein n=1 Tax=Paraburkholderia TaxID=1822464 RepID=UPI00321838D1